MANILIAGCGGIGCELGVKLVSQGHTVFGLRRNIDAIPDKIFPIQVDLSHPIPELPDHIDYVVYAASAGKHKDIAYFQAYVSGVKHTLEALENQTIKRFFFISSTSVFGQNEGEIVTEESPTADTTFSTRRLLEGEELVNNSTIPSTIIRFGGIYGPGRNHLIDLV
ncbi:MAG TPA: NAD-dependent epimerase/dehydratase family protein, partial [Thiomicrospira sp.]|nr:NAD-dependent epimerase/dehydratase family protein [Thiomicrospira sp.]